MSDIAFSRGDSVRNNFTATTDPSTANDITQGYLPGSLWVNIATDSSFQCVDSTAGAAVWKSITDGGGAADFDKILTTVAGDVITATNGNVVVRS